MKKFTVRHFYGAVLFSIIVIFLYFMIANKQSIFGVFYPLIIAFVVAYILNPLVNYLESKKMRRSVAISVVYIFIAAIIALVLWLVIPKLINGLKDLALNLPTYFDQWDAWVKLTLTNFDKNGLSQTFIGIINQNVLALQSSLIAALNGVLTGVFSFFGGILDATLIAVIAFYILLDMKKIIKGFWALVPTKYRKKTFDFLHECDLILAGYIRGQLIMGLVFGTILTVVYWVMGLEYWIVLGVAAGVLELIPFVGPFIGATIAVLVALTQSGWKALWVVVTYVIVQQFEGAVLSPKIVGRRVGLHPIVTIMAIIVVSKLFGMWYAIIAMPGIAVLKLIFVKIKDGLIPENY